jgi:UDP-2,3-diacylglucosamine pyrophosphatase LpxH
MNGYQIVCESLKSDYDGLYEDRTTTDRDVLMAKIKKYPDAYKRARELYEIWINSPQSKKVNSLMIKRFPNYNGGEDTKAAVDLMYIGMHHHPDIDKKELRANEEFIRMMLGDGIT